MADRFRAIAVSGFRSMFVTGALLAAPCAAYAQAAAAATTAEPGIDDPVATMPEPEVSPKTRAAAGLSLKRCIELALAKYPKIQEARARLASRRAQLDVAHYAPYSEFTGSAALAAVPDVRGTSIFSPNTDTAISSDMGIAWQAGIEGLVPLWTFGKITNLWDAANAGVRVGEQEVKKEQNEVKLNVRRAYYGVRLARDSLVIVRDAISRLDRYVPKLEKKVAAGDADETDLLRVQMTRAELEARESEARQKEAAALAGLGFLTGLGTSINVPDEPLEPAAHLLSVLPRYLSAARLHRPEINMARAGVLAREAEVRGEQARYLPDFGLGLSLRWGMAPAITDQQNPFVYDRANFLHYGAALIMRYKLDFLPQSARVAKARAELEAMRATERYALGGVGLEVEQSYREAEDAKRRLDAWTRATGFAKRWVIQVQQGIEVGTQEERDLIEPAKEYALKRFSQMSAVFDYNMALAKLSLATGWDVTGADE